MTALRVRSVNNVRNGPLLFLWLTPLTFLAHDLEELITMPAWIARHWEGLQSLGVSKFLPDSMPQLASAIGILLLVFCIVTFGAVRSRMQGFWSIAYQILLGAFFLHAFTHIAQALYFSGYTPGVVTAVVLVIPMCLYLYGKLLNGGLVTMKSAILTAVVGIVALLPVLFGILFLSGLATRR
jgi:hypothetical protein